MNKSFKFDFGTGDFEMSGGSPTELSGLAALEMWIVKCLRTQLGRYLIYNGTGYGANVEDLTIGGVFGLDFTKTELEREIREALLKHDDISAVENFELERDGKDGYKVKFTVTSIYGESGEEVTL